MATLVIENFKYGKDTRRSELTSQPGSLVTCINAFINEGGEAEKRRAFKLFKDCRINDETGVLGVFGLEVSSAGLAVFGSAYVFGTGGQTHVLAAAIPSGVTYMQLRHPVLTAGAGATYDATKHRMTKIRTSTSFGGTTFAVAQFADGAVFAYSGTSVVAEMVDGKVFDLLTSNTALATMAASTLSRLFPDYTITHSNNLVDVKGSLADPEYSISASDDSVNGSIAVSFVSAGSSTAPGVGAAVNITFTGGNSGSITDLTAPNGLGGTVHLLTNAVNYSASLSNTASLLATEINNTVTTPKYTAVAVGTVVTLTAAASLGASVNGNPAGTVIITYSGTLTFDSSGAIALSVAVSPTSVSGTHTPERSGNWTVYTTIPVPTGGASVATPSGGTSPYTYQWQRLDGANWVNCALSDTSASAMSPTSASSRFWAVVGAGQVRTVAFRCKVTDNVANFVYSATVYGTFEVPLTDSGN